jgi:hypothetical protein
MRRTARVVGTAAVFYAGVHAVSAFLATNAILSGAVQALLAEWGAGRAGVEWTDPAMRERPDIARRAGLGAALGLGTGALAIGFALVTRAATIERGPPALGQALVGLVVGAIGAVRDELLLRGFVLTALRGWVSPAASIAICAVAGAAASFGEGNASPGELLVAALASAAFAALWIRDRGAWLAVGAHAGFVFATGTLARGALLDVRSALGPWGGGDAGLPGSLAVAVVVGVSAAFAIAWAIRPRATSA